ncbi:MAG: isoleucine--tRNA ligase [Patescibacteria group bacterium]|nr:isoleucine--tRNA ligase [Patescibacteria group bacterium]
MDKKSKFAEMEEATLDFWDKGKFFERSVNERPEDRQFVFYDGPPFATGLPHYGNLLAGLIKDVFPRYKTMRGFRVRRVWGWDCHGLPIETMIEKELGLNSKDEIESLGIDKFCKACRDSVMRYAEEWKRIVRRTGRWVDMENTYRTMDNPFIESVWWVFSELNKKELVYKDRRVSHYCPRCATPLSNTEVGVDTYKDVEDPAIIVKFKLKNESNTYLLAWTTTPWTLPANAALAVDPEMNYLRVRIKSNNETYIFSESRKNEVLKDIVYPIEDEDEEEMKVEFLGIVKGKKLLGLEYEPLYNFIKLDKKAHFVIAGDFVTADEGTGIVHVAPGFGEVDMEAGKKADLPVIVTVDDQAKFLPEITPWAGRFVKDADEDIMKELETRGALFKRETCVHSYPHCWRCKTPLIYKAQNAWFVNVTSLKAKLLKNNEHINWRPEHIKKGRFGKTLETSPDWCVSRTRYWGAPIPVWECAACGAREVIGSVAELGEKAENFREGTDLHRPFIDEIKIKCSCGGEMNRIREVFDCWFESGSMPYGQAHYPFENKKWFDDNFPADFIAEGQDQTRGWFNKLHVLATALFNKNAFKNVIVNGIVLAEDGKKMSKSLKNYPDPWILFNSYGVDSMRYYLFSSPAIEAENLNFCERDVAEIERKVLMLIWNVYKFYELYAAEDTQGVDEPSDNVLDRWIIARLENLIAEVTTSLDNFSLIEASRPIVGFIDELSTWFVRRSRDRFKSEDRDEKKKAVATLGEVLVRLALVMAPFTPFIAEEVWRSVTGRAADSVHLEAWPESRKNLIDKKLLAEMEVVRAIASRGLEARAVAGIPVRQILASVKVSLNDAKLADILKKKIELLDLVRDELNVEAVEIAAGGKDDIAVELDTVITPELAKKGLAREIVRHVNSLRKKAGLTINDRITLYYDTEFAMALDVLRDMKNEVMADVLADDIRAEKKELAHAEIWQKDGEDIWIGIKKK